MLVQGERFSELQVRQLLRLCRQIREEADVAVRKQRLLGGLCRMVGAVTGMAAVLRDDFTVGEELTVVRVTAEPASPDDDLSDVSVDAGDVTNAGGPEFFSLENPMVRPFIRTLGERLMEPTAFARREVVPDDEWYTSEFYRRFRQPRGLDDCILSAVPLPKLQPFVAVICLSGQQSGSLPNGEQDLTQPIRGTFTAQDRRLVQFVHAELRWLYYASLGSSTSTGFPEEPAPGPGPQLSPRHQRVLLRLIAGDSEKQAAQQLGLSPHSVHEYVRAIYRKMGVSSRAELMAQLY